MLPIMICTHMYYSAFLWQTSLYCMPCNQVLVRIAFSSLRSHLSLSLPLIYKWQSQDCTVHVAHVQRGVAHERNSTRDHDMPFFSLFNFGFSFVNTDTNQNTFVFWSLANVRQRRPRPRQRQSSAEKIREIFESQQSNKIMWGLSNKLCLS